MIAYFYKTKIGYCFYLIQSHHQLFYPVLMIEKGGTKKTAVAILGCRGVPNHYGGFEELAEHLSLGLVSLGYAVYVYNMHNHPVRDKNWKGVHRLFCFDPEKTIGTPGQFIYDLNCINDSRDRGFDIIIQLGYTSSSIWHRRLPSGAKIITNMDGLEWKRQKYSKLARHFLKYAELLAVRNSDMLIADNPVIKDYLESTYGVSSTYIPYGADNCLADACKNDTVIKLFIPAENTEQELHRNRYCLLIARLQPDNHIEEIIQGALLSGKQSPLVVVGNYQTRYGMKLYKKYASKNVLFAGGIFQSNLLNHLRNNASLYFHGHSAGGTNPSLLQAMATGVPICAHDNPFNRSVLGDDAYYFKTSSEIASVIPIRKHEAQVMKMTKNNIQKIKTLYSWRKIVHQYNEIIQNIH